MNLPAASQQEEPDKYSQRLPIWRWLSSWVRRIRRRLVWRHVWTWNAAGPAPPWRLQKAVELSPESVEYQITLADAQRQLGRAAEAMEGTRKVLRQSDLSPQDQARARLILGRIWPRRRRATTGRPWTRPWRRSRWRRRRSIVGEERRRGAMRQILINAELSLAEILAYGPWKQKHEVIPQWLVTAEKAANEYIEKDGGRDVLLSVYNTSLHCLLVLDGQGRRTTLLRRQFNWAAT